MLISKVIVNFVVSGPNLEFMGRVLMFRKRARQCPMHVSQMRLHYSWRGGWGAVNLKISCYVLSGVVQGRRLQKKGQTSNQKTHQPGVNSVSALWE